MEKKTETDLSVQKQKWNLFIEEKKDFFDDFFYKNYLSLCKVMGVENEKIIVAVPSTYTKRILLEKRIDEQFKNNDYEVIFTVIKVWKEQKKQKTQMTNEEEFTFDNLVVAKFNSSVVEITKKIINKENIWSPFFLYSEPGLGKTHILRAVKNTVKNTSQKCYYIHANTFGSLLLNKFNQGSNAIEEFSNNFNDFDIIIFDDIQFLAKREKTNEVLFKIFSSAIDQKKQVIFSSDQHPDELNGFEKRLKSRFQNGIILKINYPGINAGIEIVKKKIENLIKNVSKIDLETIEYIAKNFKKDIRKIEGVIKRIAFYLLKNPEKEIDLESFKHLFADQKFVFNHDGVSIKTIKKIVAKFYNVSYNSLSSKGRKSIVVKARSVSMYLIRNLTNENYSTIALHFNAKTHSTVVNAIKKIKKQKELMPEYQNEIQHLKQLCQNN